MQPYNINRTLKHFFKESMQTHNEEDARLHFHTDVHIAALVLLATGDGAEEAQGAHTKLAAQLVGVGLDEVDVFAGGFHLHGN